MLWTIEAKDDYGYGYAAGSSRERLFRAVLNRAEAGLRRIGADPARVAERTRRHLDILAGRYPAYLERVTGLSRALGMETREVLAGSLAVSSVL